MTAGTVGVRSPAARRSIGALLLYSTLTQVITFTLRPTATYRALELDVPTPWLGALGACFAIVPLALAVPSGQATDRFGERRVMVLGATLMAGSAGVFLLLGSTVAGLVAGSVVLGTGQLFAVVGQQTAVANAAEPGRFDSAFGYYTFAASLGQAIGPALIVLVGGSGAIPDTAAVFGWSCALGVALIGCSLLLRRPVRANAGKSDTQGSLKILLRLPGLIRALLVSCVVLSAVDISLVFLPALGADRDLAAGFIGLLLTLRALASMGSRLLLGQLVKLLGRRRLMVSSIVLSAVSMATIAAPLPAAITVTLVALLGLGLGVGQPLTMSWLAEVAPSGLRGRAMSLRLTGNRLGQVAIPSAVGAVAAGIGAAGVLWTTAAVLGATGVAARKLSVGTTPTTDDPGTIPPHPSTGGTK